eukprot:scaffold131675_cov14-Tisochrysis_lutea.AAC.1
MRGREGVGREVCICRSCWTWISLAALKMNAPPLVWTRSSSNVLLCLQLALAASIMDLTLLSVRHGQPCSAYVIVLKCTTWTVRCVRSGRLNLHLMGIHALSLMGHQSGPDPGVRYAAT